MAKKKIISNEPIMGYVYRPIHKSHLYVGRPYYLKLENETKYRLQTIRDRITINHKLGCHVGETNESYGEYRDEMDLWCDKGRLYDRFYEVIGNDQGIGVVSVTTTVKVSLRPDIKPSVLFEVDESKDAMCLLSFEL
jgi:hypothetical protein